MLLGHDIPLNFNLPYTSTSLSQFWAKWHISLSSWIRDYIYIPLGGRRCSWYRTASNIMIAMLLSGLWHGADLRFLIWGGYHGILILLEKLLSHLGIVYANVFTTFSFVCIGWIFFRSPTIESSLEFFKGMQNWRIPLDPELPHLQVFLLLALCFIVWNNSKQLLDLCQSTFEKLPLVLKSVMAAVIITAILSVAPDGMPSFIYTSF